MFVSITDGEKYCEPPVVIDEVAGGGVGAPADRSRIVNGLADDTPRDSSTCGAFAAEEGAQGVTGSGSGGGDGSPPRGGATPGAGGDGAAGVSLAPARLPRRFLRLFPRRSGSSCAATGSSSVAGAAT